VTFARETMLTTHLGVQIIALHVAEAASLAVASQQNIQKVRESLIAGAIVSVSL
jgi:hypothetical protein